MVDNPRVFEGLYGETLRPQFHFTAAAGWLNDPNGLVYYGGLYHLFFQHNPFSVKWGNMTWGHAISRDLVHWEQLPSAIEPDARGTIFSGSAVVDWGNTAGFGREALVALYTAAGECVSPPAPTTQCLAYSTDGGRTWDKYRGNPVLTEIAPGNRDPHVFWHAPTGRWIMALYVGKAGRHFVQFFASADLKTWSYLSEIEGFYECPNLLPFGDEWVLFGADGAYVVGRFDGCRFTVTGGKYLSDWGANFYAAQTYSDIPPADGRRILIGFMCEGQYPDMPFNQQLTFPCELTLRGQRLCKWPVREIESLYATTHERPDFQGDLFDIEAEVEVGHAIAFAFNVRGFAVQYLVGDRQLRCGRQSAPLPPIAGKVKLRLLIDRTSVEVFGNGGTVTVSSCFLPKASNRRVWFDSDGGRARLADLQVRELKPIWNTRAHLPG